MAPVLPALCLLAAATVGEAARGRGSHGHGHYASWLSHDAAAHHAGGRHDESATVKREEQRVHASHFWRRADSAQPGRHRHKHPNNRAHDGDTPVFTLPLEEQYGGVFTVNISLGTPAQALTLQIDTFSTDVWVASAACVRTFVPAFDNASSSSYLDDGYSVSLPYELRGGASVNVEVSRDTFWVDSTAPAASTQLTFGLATREDTYWTFESYAGILGLALSALSRVAPDQRTLVDHLADSTGMDRVFALYLSSNSSAAPSSLTLGGYDPTHAYDPSSSPAWAAVLGMGAPSSPPSGYDMWRIRTPAVTMACVEASVQGPPNAGCQPDVAYRVAATLAVQALARNTPFKSTAFAAAPPASGSPSSMSLCDPSTSYCTSVLASCYGDIYLPSPGLIPLIAVINASCDSACGVDAVTGTHVTCPLSCDVSQLPNITFQVLIGDMDDPSPDSLDYTLLPTDYVELEGDALVVRLRPYDRVDDGETRFLLGTPFLRPYMTIFDETNTRVGFVSTRAVGPTGGGGGGGKRFWGSGVMWATVVAVAVAVVLVFGCFMIARDRMREGRSKALAAALQQRLMSPEEEDGHTGRYSNAGDVMMGSLNSDQSAARGPPERWMSGEFDISTVKV